MDFSRKLPIGIQDFESLRKDNFLYVDKTEYVYRIVNEGRLKIGAEFSRTERTLSRWINS
jgi:hypothetical protein